MSARLYTDTEELMIVRIYKSGISARAIARVYGTTHHVIAQALRRQNATTRNAAERNTLYPMNSTIFDVIDTEAKAYWLGFIYADGGVRKRTLQVGLAAKDTDHQRALLAFLESNAPIYDGMSLGHHLTTIAITDEHLTDRLRTLGITPQRPNHLQSTSEIPQSLIRHFIRGLFDGDGSAKRRPCISFLGSQSLMLFIRDTIAAAIGTSPILKPTPHSISTHMFYLDFMGRIQAPRVAAYLYRDATVYLKRKREVVEKWEAATPRTRDESGRFQNPKRNY